MAGRDVEAGQAFVRLALSGRAQVETGLRALGSRMTSFAGLASRLTASIGAIGLGAGFIASIKSASDMQETMSKFNVVFGESAEAVKKWADETASAFGRSKKQVASFLASAQDLLVPLGFDAEKAEELSKQITKLAFDLGSFNNIADEDVFRDLQAAMTGSGEVMKKYGVVVSEARVKQELLNESIDPKFATEAQKAYARLQLILQGTAAAQGDALRTSDSFANSMKRFHAVVADAAVELGEKFLPAATTLVQVLSDAIIVLADMTKGTSALGGEFELSASTVIDALGEIVNAVNFVAAAMKDLRAELKVFEFLPVFMRFSVEDAVKLRKEIEKLKDEATAMRQSDFAEDFRKRLEAMQETREKAKAEAAAGGIPGGAGDVQAALESTQRKLSPEKDKAMQQLIQHEKGLLEEQKKSNDQHAGLMKDTTRVMDKAVRVLEDIKRQGEDVTPVEVID